MSIVLCPRYPVFNRSMYSKYCIIFALLYLCLQLGACGSMVSSAKKDFAKDLSATILEFNDAETVRQAIPAYLLLISSMIRGDSDNAELLVSGSKLYAAYASVFVEDVTRKAILSNRAFEYAEQALCLQRPLTCNTRNLSFYEFERLLQTMEKSDADTLFAYGSAWGGLIEAKRADWNVIAELPKVKSILQRVLELDESVSNGDAHLYMGVMESLLPPAMGGKIDIARQHYEKALKISNRSNLMAMVMYAEKYARLIFDKSLHDQLLNEVLDADQDQKQTESALLNSIAKQKARELLAEDYF